MEVKKSLLYSLLLLALLQLFTVGCSNTSNGNSGLNKATSDPCIDAAISNEKVVRWKNGKISRWKKQKQSDSLEKFYQDNADQIEGMEDNFKISRPVVNSLYMMKSSYAPKVNWGIDSINAKDLWNKNVYGEGVIVATVDSGIDTEHDQLASQLYTNPKEIAGNGIDDDKNGYIDDVHGYDFTASSGNLQDTTGHGTHVAGIIAANHSGKVKGVAPKSKLVVYDFFGPEGDGSVYDAIRAIRAAAQMGAKVINASWGGPNCSESLRRVIRELGDKDKDVLFVAAAGNDHQNIDNEPSYPAAYVIDNQITVAAMSEDEYTAGFSNYGSRVHIAAPGMGIVSTYPYNDYQVEDGTSMAAPFVSGAAALLRSAFPGATAAQIKKALIAGVRKGPYPVSSRGSLDVSASYDYLEDQSASQQALP